MAAVRSVTTHRPERPVLPLDWNGPVDRPFTPFAEGDKARPIIELLESVVRRYPARVALLDTHSSITYADLWREIAVCAEYIAAATGPGEVVGILAPTSIRFPVAMLACLAAGRAFVALDPRNPRDWMTRSLNNARPALLLALDHDEITVTDITVSSSGRGPRYRPFDSMGSAAPSWRPARMTPDEPACVLYTSGSTGHPKGIVNSQRNLLQRVAQSINAAHLDTDDCLLTLAAPSTIVGVRDAITALLAGASLLLLDAHESGATEILRALREHRVTILFAFPALLRSVVQGGLAPAAEQLRLVRLGGDTTLQSDIDLLRAWLAPGAHVQLIYAATEAPMLQWFVTGVALGTEGRIPIGYPLPGNELMVVDDAGLPVRQGVAGELVVRSPYVALGIWSEGRCRTEGVQVDPLDPTVRLWKSGDLVRQRSDGFFERLGRKDRQVKIRGVRVEPEGVEAAIRRYSQVRDVGVVAHADVTGALRLIAFIAWHGEPERQSLSALRETLSQSLPPHMLPWRCYAVPLIPRLPNSKLDVRALQELAQEQSKLDAARVTPIAATATGASPAALVARIWCDVLQVASIEPEDDFFDLGGDSLRAIALMVELEKVLRRAVPLTLINRAPTLAAFCTALGADHAESYSESYSPLVMIKPGRAAPPLFLIHGASGNVTELFTLGRNVAWPGPVIGVQAQGLDGREPPHRRVEAMASAYLGAIKIRQPEGPYLLCGFSFGGSVALEVACRLRAAGDAVAFLGLLDALPPGNHWLRVWTWTAYLWREVAQRISGAQRRPRRDHGRAGTWAVARMRLMMLRALRASVAYRPRAYTGELTIFEASQRDLGVPSMAVPWGRYATTVCQRTLPGRHREILTGAGALTAAHLLTQSLEAAWGLSPSVMCPPPSQPQCVM
jgi:amino acid adenylation domain-containing protein